MSHALVLFDIDGTLIEPGGAGAFCETHGMEDAFAVSTGPYSYEALREAGADHVVRDLPYVFDIICKIAI